MPSVGLVSRWRFVAYVLDRAAGELAPRAPEERHPKDQPQPRPANLNAIAEGPIAPPSTPGSLHIRGKVAAREPPGHLRVTAVSSPPNLALLLELHRDCVSDVSHAPLVCGCGDAELELLRDLDQREGESRPVARAEVAADGTFDLPGLPEGQFTLWLDGPGVLSSRSVQPQRWPRRWAMDSPSPGPTYCSPCPR